MKVLIADDHAILRHGLKEILTGGFKDIEFGDAANTQQTLDQLDRKQWDILILDISMPGRNGLEVLRETRERWPRLAVLVLSSAPEEQLAIRVLKAGAAGYMNKQSAPEELVEAIRKLLAGGKYISSRVAERLATEIGRSNRPPHEQLSDREFQVMQMLAAGKSLKEISDALSLSAKTISTFRGRILTKLTLSNNVQLAHYARDNGLLENRS
jgi:two-component system invasion response regulator UvrY